MVTLFQYVATQRGTNGLGSSLYSGVALPAGKTSIASESETGLSWSTFSWNQARKVANSNSACFLSSMVIFDPMSLQTSMSE